MATATGLRWSNRDWRYGLRIVLRIKKASGEASVVENCCQPAFGMWTKERRRFTLVRAGSGSKTYCCEQYALSVYTDTWRQVWMRWTGVWNSSLVSRFFQDQWSQYFRGDFGLTVRAVAVSSSLEKSDNRIDNGRGGGYGKRLPLLLLPKKWWFSILSFENGRRKRTNFTY